MIGRIGVLVGSGRGDREFLEEQQVSWGQHVKIKSESLTHTPGFLVELEDGRVIDIHAQWLVVDGKRISGRDA